jgi:putative ABC transport system substrate-binding protein
MRRRALLGFLGAAALAQPARAQQAGRFYRIGVLTGAGALHAAQQATRTIPIIGGADDMVGDGLVKSFAHPEGNLTGVGILASELDGKRLEIPQQLRPSARRIAPALGAIKAAGAAGVDVLASALLFFSRRIVLEQSAALRLPAIYQWPAMAETGDGGLIGYGPNLNSIYGDQRARIAAEILRGTKPADIPVENPERFYLTVNLKTANELAVTVPRSLLAQADEVVE